MSKSTIFSGAGHHMPRAEKRLSKGKAMAHDFRFVILFAAVFILAFTVPARAQQMTELVEEPDHIRGQVTGLNGSSITVATKDRGSVSIVISDVTTILSLSEASFTDVDFGVYVGSVSKKLDEYSPIVRDSMSWLHEGYELRIFDEELRGLALGHTTWDLTPESVITHGWVDDLEVRVISIKYGSTEEEETDVRIERDKPVLYLKFGDQTNLKQDTHVFAGARKNGDGAYEAEYIIAGEDDVKPGL